MKNIEKGDCFLEVYKVNTERTLIRYIFILDVFRQEVKADIIKYCKVTLIKHNDTNDIIDYQVSYMTDHSISFNIYIKNMSKTNKIDMLKLMHDSFEKNLTILNL